MANCCFCNPFYICGDICQNIEINATAPLQGVYSLYYKYFMIGKNIEATFNQGEALVFDSKSINPVYKYEMQLLYNGQAVLLSDGVDTFDHLVINAQPHSGKIITKPFTIII